MTTIEIVHTEIDGSLHCEIKMFPVRATDWEMRQTILVQQMIGRLRLPALSMTSKNCRFVFGKQNNRHFFQRGTHGKVLDATGMMKFAYLWFAVTFPAVLILIGFEASRLIEQLIKHFI